MKISDSAGSLMPLVAGTAGALALNTVHEIGRQVFRYAPHMDFIGMRALGKPLQKFGRAPRNLLTLRRWTLFGDVVSNSLYYSTIAMGEKNPSAIWRRGALLGLSAGIGAVVLPPRMNLGQQKSGKPWITYALTVSWYFLGGLTAAAVAQAFNRMQTQRKS